MCLLLINLVATARPVTRGIVARLTSMTVWITNVSITPPASIKSNLTAAIARADTQVIDLFTFPLISCFLNSILYYPWQELTAKRRSSSAPKISILAKTELLAWIAVITTLASALLVSAEKTVPLITTTASATCVRYCLADFKPEFVANRFVDCSFAPRTLERWDLCRRYQRVHLQVPAWILWQVLRGLPNGQPVVPSDFPLSTARLPERHLLPTSRIDRLHLQMCFRLYR